MNPLKIVLPLLVVGGAIAVWQFSPAARSKVRDTLGKYAAWTEEARKEDPVGYIEFAIAKLEDDKSKFVQAKASLKAAKQEAEAKRADYTTKHGNAVELASSLKSAFQNAEGGAGYPVAFMSKEYTREQLVDQVARILAERDAYDGAVDEFTDVIDLIETTAAELAARTTKVEISITELKVKRDVVEVKQLTADTEELMSNVYDLLGENEDTLGALPEDDDPVRSLEEFMRAMELEARAPVEGEIPAEETDAVMAFLEG